ncbi:MAG: hypothetical protein AAF268_11910 [Cyanobacteria bacterium P01_A01_bin.3]
MLSLFSGLISRERSDWCARVSDPMREIEAFYKSRAEISLKQRRKTAFERLRKLEGISPYAAKTILMQWDEAMAASRKSSTKASTGKVKRTKPHTNSQTLSERSRTQVSRQLAQQHAAIHELRIGELLQKAGLLTPTQIEIALMEQKTCAQQRLGHIFAGHGWIKAETVDFFMERFPTIHRESYRFPLGRYLKDAALLDTSQVGHILHAQTRSLRPVMFGALAVSQGYVKQETVDIVLQQLAAR